MPFIEIVAIVREERDVDGYESRLELTTSAKREVACFEQALELRETAVNILKRSGLSETDIGEGGGTIDQGYWSSKKSIEHRITIRKNNIEVLMAAMAALERHFAALPRPFWGGIKHDFRFAPPRPIYKSSASAEESLRKAIQNARRTAEVIANETGYLLGGLISVVEQFLDRVPDVNEDDADDVDDDLRFGDHETLQQLTYSRLPTNTAKKSRRFHVRFAAEIAASTK